MRAMFSRAYRPETTAAGWVRFLLNLVLCAWVASVAFVNHHPRFAWGFVAIGAVHLCGQAPPPATKDRWIVGLACRAVGLVVAVLTMLAWRRWGHWSP